MYITIFREFYILDISNILNYDLKHHKVKEKKRNAMFELTKECNVHAKTNVFDFGESLEIWWIKPHVANRRLAGTVSFQDFEFDYGLKTAEQCLECISNVIKHMNFQQKETLITSSSSTGDGAQAIHIRNYSDSIGGDKASTTSDMSLDLLDFKRMFNPVLTYFCGSVVCKNSVVKCSIRKLLPRSQDLFSSTYELMLRKMGMPMLKCAIISVLQGVP